MRSLVFAVFNIKLPFKWPVHEMVLEIQLCTFDIYLCVVYGVLPTIQWAYLKHCEYLSLLFLWLWSSCLKSNGTGTYKCASLNIQKLWMLFLKHKLYTFDYLYMEYQKELVKSSYEAASDLKTNDQNKTGRNPLECKSRMFLIAMFLHN